MDDFGYLAYLERLGQEIKDPFFERFFSCFRGCKARYHNDLGLRGALFHLGQELHAVNAFHLEVRDHDIEIFFPDSFQGRQAFSERFDLVSFFLQRRLEPLADNGLVVEY
ncbi:hypothetical protein BMS3Abin13_01014 [bacterium BMS3Abin13]|nr:hypothetical protein BMS3Abin13_01014 [bacterium BMS3Abin13]